MLNSPTLEVKEKRYWPLKGTPTLILRDSNGKIVDKHRSGNLIVKLGRGAIIKLLSGDLTSHISKCSVGTGGANPDTPFVAIPPTDDDSGLSAEVSGARKDIDGHIIGDGIDLDGTETVVTFTTLFKSIDVNAIVNEAALFFGDGTIFARYTFPSMYLKDDKGYSLEIAWEIQF